MDLQLTNYFPSETEGAEYEDRDISMDSQFSNNFPSETEGVEYEDGDIDRTIYFWGTEMPKWFNHQSVDNSIFFFVGRKFPKLAVCIVPGREVVSVSVHISINGYKKSYLYFRDLVDVFKFLLTENNLFLFSLTQRSLQRHLNKSNPTDQNLVEVSITYSESGYSVKRWGVHVECTCPPQESNDDDDVDYRNELPFYGSDDVDYWSELPFCGSDGKEEYQLPLVHDCTSMSCMSWLVGPTTKLFKLFCFCCPRDFS